MTLVAASRSISRTYIKKKNWFTVTLVPDNNTRTAHYAVMSLDDSSEVGPEIRKQE